MKTITITQEEFDKKAREVARKSFVLGVDWLCKLLVRADVFDFSQDDADRFHRQAERTINEAA